MTLSHFSAILSGFSIVCAFILLFAYFFFLEEMRKTRISKLSCCAVLLGLAAIQSGHYLFFIQGIDLINSGIYCSLLMALPIAFFFFGREVLFHEIKYSFLDAAHFLPFMASFFLHDQLIPSLAFLIGTAYTIWLVTKIYNLREERKRFKFEIFFFGLFALMAIAALLLGLFLPVIEVKIFYIAYSISISISMVLVISALLIFPELLSDIALITEFAYSKSKLSGINVEEKLLDLERLMVEEREFENEQLSLSTVSELLCISTHQLSELINTKFGYSFPRFVREHRVRAAKSLLITDPKTSILAISMMTGFKSQSNFYTAFKESTGESPGEYRQKRLS